MPCTTTGLATVPGWQILVSEIKEVDVSAADPGRLEGVFRTAVPVAVAIDRTPCHVLLRFYADGRVLHVSLCADVEAHWPDIAAWFDREAGATDAEPGVGAGTYALSDSQIRFHTVAFDRETGLTIALDHWGAVRQDHLTIATRLRGDGRVVEREFVRLAACRA